jgi:apolipoprotein D and lipocalin family protein
MMHMRSALAGALLVSFCTLAAAEPAAVKTPPAQALEPIPALDVPRYAGKWYEIAKFPNPFQRKCIGFTTAEYNPNPDGTLEVVNRCKEQDGAIKEAFGAARQVGGANSAKLEVRFAPAWLSFVPLVWADYWVIDLDPNYQLAAVSEPKREYLWILSRTPKVDLQSYTALVARLAALGFDVKKLVFTRQNEQPAIAARR